MAVFALAAVLVLGSSGCAANHPAGVAVPPATSSRSSPALPSSSATASATGAASHPTPVALSPAPSAQAPTPPPPLNLLVFHEELDGQARSVAFGEEGRVAALMDQPWLLRDGRWKKLELPTRWRLPALERERLQIFFGRDNKPRLMGWRWAAPDAQVTSEPYYRQVYLRWRRNAWRDGKKEIGRLSGKPGEALYGILGFEDPEVVCKARDVCIIKRRTGWTTFPASRRHLRVVRTSDHTIWALDIDYPEVLQLRDDRWRPYREIIPAKCRVPFSSVATRNQQVWLLSGSNLYACNASGCTIQQSPLTTPKALLGSEKHDGRLWLVGRDGIATYDGTSWRRARGPDDELHGLSRGPQGNLWLLGKAHLWRATLETRDVTPSSPTNDIANVSRGYPHGG